MNKKIQKPIRALEHKAQQGSIKALFQLAEYYKDGRFVEQDEELANSYYEKVISILKKQKLRISSTQLIDFRVFKNCEVDFCIESKCGSNLTVIIGNNGAGKTTIVDAISYCLSWFRQRMVRKNGNGVGIDKGSDIHIYQDQNLSEYASILTKIELSDEFGIELSTAKDGSNTSRKNNLSDINQLADIYKYANSQDSLFNLPIMAVYSVGRALEIIKKDISSFENNLMNRMNNKFDAYDQALNGRADFKLFSVWFKKIDDNYNASYVEAIKSSKSSGVNEELPENIDRKSIDHVLNAISLCMPDLSNLRIQRTPVPDMLVDKHKDNITLSVLQLSQGEKTLMALVADIARRLIILNPSLDKPLKGSGIVLIDEIDLHLHPKWQQSIVPNLQKTFPNVQFIITTHSPQVLSTVPKKSVRTLGINENGDNVVTIPLAESYGMPSNDVLQAIMHVDPQPPVREIALLDELTSLVDQGQYESQQAKNLLNELKQSLNEHHPQILKIERSIRRQKILKR